MYEFPEMLLPFHTEPHRIIDVFVIEHILDDEDEEQETIESMLVPETGKEDEDQQQHDDDDDGDGDGNDEDLALLEDDDNEREDDGVEQYLSADASHAFSPTNVPFTPRIVPLTPRRLRRLGVLYVSLLSVVLLLASTGLVLLMTGSIQGLVRLHPSPRATVLLVPASRTLTTSTTLSIQGHTLDAVILQQSRTVPTTGHIQLVARAATGWLTFYNAAPTTQRMPAGTVLTASNGVQVITQQETVLPAATPPLEGQAQVLAVSRLAGAQGNLAARMLSGACCQSNLFVASSAFIGGQDARIVSSVASEDITTTTTLLTRSLNEAMHAVLQTQVHAQDTLITPLACSFPQTTDSFPVGTQATQVTVQVTQTCQGVVLDTASWQEQVREVVTQDAQQRLGASYTLLSTLHPTVRQVLSSGRGDGTTTAEHLSIAITCTSTWVYQISVTQQQHIQSLLLGKTEETASTCLLQEPGIQAVSIALSEGNTLPEDPHAITVMLLAPTES